MGIPVVLVDSGGLPVTETERGTPVTIAENGFGIPVTVVESRGYPVTGIAPVEAATVAATVFAESTALWSVGRAVIPGATPVVLTGSAITTINDQVGTRNASGVGSPQINTDGVNGNDYAVMDATNDEFSFSTLNLTGDFTIVASLGLIALVGTQRTLLGRSNVNRPYIRVAAANSNDMAFRSDTVGDQGLVIASGLQKKRGFNVYTFKRVSNVIETFINGVSQGTVTLAGEMPFDCIGKSNTAQFLGDAFGELAIWDRALSNAEQAAIQADMMAAWRAPFYFDPVLGADANSGWNEANPKQSLFLVRNDFTLPGREVRLKSGAVFRDQPLSILQSGGGGSAARPNIVDIYDGTAPALLYGSELFPATSVWTLVAGTEYSIVASGASEAAWYIDTGVTIRLNSVGTTAGSLSVGQSAFSAGRLHVNVGENPTAFDVEHARSTVGTDGIEIINDYWTVRNVQTQFWPGNGQRISGSTGVRFEDTFSHFNAQDGYNFSGSAQDWTVLRGDSRNNGQGLATGGSLGDGYSAHGGSLGTLEACVAVDNDKSSFNHEGNAKITQIDCEASGANIVCNILDQGGTNCALVIIGGSYARRAGSTIKEIVHIESTGGGTLTMSGNITLDGAEATTGVIGIKSDAGSSVSGDISDANITYVDVNTQIDWDSSGALVQ